MEHWRSLTPSGPPQGIEPADTTQAHAVVDVLERIHAAHDAAVDAEETKREHSPNEITSKMTDEERAFGNTIPGAKVRTVTEYITEEHL